MLSLSQTTTMTVI